MNRKHNKQIVPLAKVLRRNMTREERKLWYEFLRGYPVRFLRQKVIGNYVADFYCARAKLVVELDGSQHYEEKGLREDEERTSVLKGYGVTVLRFANNQITQNFEGVCQSIDRAVKERISL